MARTVRIRTVRASVLAVWLTMLWGVSVVRVKR